MEDAKGAAVRRCCGKECVKMRHDWKTTNSSVFQGKSFCNQECTRCQLERSQWIFKKGWNYYEKVGGTKVQVVTDREPECNEHRMRSALR